MATLTLVQGDARAEFTDHPIEVARRALVEAADLEPQSSGWSPRFRRVADALPQRERTRRTDQRHRADVGLGPERRAASALAELAEHMDQDDPLRRACEVLSAALDRRSLRRR